MFRKILFGIAVLCSITGLAAQNTASTVMTLSGPVPAKELGTVLSHEHILVDFGGAETAGPDRYDADAVFDFILPHLEEAKALGIDTLFECTPAYLGRDVELLQRLSVASGVTFVTNTGYYGAGKDRFVPDHAYTDSAETIASRWIREFHEGIDGTDIRPGFIKTAFDNGPPSEIDTKLFEAAILAHLETGLTIATHTGGNTQAANVQLKRLEHHGVSPSEWIWVHAQNVKDFSDIIPAFEAGAWISFDGVRESSLQKHTHLLRSSREAGFLDQVLISHDAGWYRVGEPGGAPEKFRPYSTIHNRLLPLLEEAGFEPEEIQQLLSSNPQRAFQISL